MLLLAAGAAATGAGAAAADEAGEATARILAIEGDPAFGEYLGGECATCHRPSADAAIPAIHGLDAEHIVSALVEYRMGIRDSDVMRLMAARLADDEIAALAAYFSRAGTE